MSFMVQRTESDFKPAPEGLHQGVCIDVIDLGMKDGKWGPKHTCRLWWQLELRDDETEKRFRVKKDYNVSLHEKANLCKDLVAWRGRKFTDEEAAGFDVESVIGANCQLQVAHNLGDNGTVWANVMTVVPLGKNMTKLRPEEYVRDKDRTDTQAENSTGNGGGMTQAAAAVEDDNVPF